jgi:phosphohistidine phosphatase
MKIVYIVRHAKSSWDDPGLPDVVRPLNQRGKKASVKMGKYLAKLGDMPDIIVSSPATRAYHTALNIARQLGYRSTNIRVESSIYYEGEFGVMETIRQLSDAFQSACIVGHEPTCSDVIYSLCGELPGKFATASIFKIELDISSWGDLPGVQGKKIYFISPKSINDFD